MIRGIYAIVDAGGAIRADRAVSASEALLAGGVRVLQLRAKTLPDRDVHALAAELRALTTARGARLVIDDRPDIACLVGADGVHLGQTDLPPAAVRPWLPRGMGLGVSCHNLSELEAALAAGLADHAGYGPVYATRSKANPDPVVGPAGLAEAVRFAGGRLPLVAIGGVTVERLPEIRAAGAAAAAMIADLLGAADVATRAAAAVGAFEGGGGLR